MAPGDATIAVGETRSFGEYEVTADEIITFGRKYDPQPFHTDPEAAGESMFGELVASGWHTAAMTMRMLVDHYLSDPNFLGSPGVDTLRWRKPVTPGDTLGVTVEIVAIEPWSDDRELIRSDVTTVNQDEEPVLSMEALTLYTPED